MSTTTYEMRFRGVMPTLLAAVTAAGMYAIPAAAQTAPTREQALAAQLKRERAAWAHERAGLRARARDAWRHAITTPDAEIAMRLAATAYGQDWRHLRACALSEGYRNAERFTARIPRPNRAGSGAFGPWLFMPGTWASTPYASFDPARVDAQALATAWMWSRGRRGEWTGAGC